MKKRFVFTCVSPKGSVSQLNAAIDRAREVTWETFRNNISQDDLKECFPNYNWNGIGGLHIKDDWSVSFHKTVWAGRRAYYVRHSAIEYFFI